MSTAAEHVTTRLRMTDPRYAEVHEWLVEEAELLDGHQLEAWLARLADDVTYRMPVRPTLENGADDSATYYHLDENFESLWVRVHRVLGGSAWAENPPSRTRRIVSNVRVALDATNAEFEASSYLLLLRSRGDATNYEIMSCDRRDRLRRVEGDLLVLAYREILVDQSSLGMANLSVFL